MANDEHVEIAIAEGTRVVVNETGQDTYLENIDIFQMIIGIRDDMLAGDQDSLQNVRLTELGVAQDQLLISQAVPPPNAPS